MAAATKVDRIAHRRRQSSGPEALPDQLSVKLDLAVEGLELA